MDEKRLESFEKMLSAVRNEFQSVKEQMEGLKARGNVKSATYQQLMGRKMMYQNMLLLYEIYGLVGNQE